MVQKYIERPLLIHGYKFDIRQWVLVTGYNPLTVWFYEECYLRFCCHPFTLENLADRFIHLANNSIQKNSDDFEASPFPENMWPSTRFRTWLQEQTGRDLWLELLQPRLKAIVVLSLKASQDMMDQRNGCFELFGYDFMIDQDLRPWLIEINSSPDLTYSTAVTEKLVKEVSEDIVKVIVDHRDVELARKSASAAASKSDKRRSPRAEDESGGGAGAGPAEASPGPDVRATAPQSAAAVPYGKLADTGKWTCVFRARRALQRPLGSLTHDFSCVGSPVA